MWPERWRNRRPPSPVARRGRRRPRRTPRAPRPSRRSNSSLTCGDGRRSPAGSHHESVTRRDRGPSSHRSVVRLEVTRAPGEEHDLVLLGELPDEFDTDLERRIVGSRGEEPLPVLRALVRGGAAGDGRRRRRRRCRRSPATRSASAIGDGERRLCQRDVAVVAHQPRDVVAGRQHLLAEVVGGERVAAVDGRARCRRTPSSRRDPDRRPRRCRSSRTCGRTCRSTRSRSARRRRSSERRPTRLGSAPGATSQNRLRDTSSGSPASSTDISTASYSPGSRPPVPSVIRPK